MVLDARERKAFAGKCEIMGVWVKGSKEENAKGAGCGGFGSKTLVVENDVKK
jgi:hypothetical protein